ncbi:probable calcium-binding protein CML23 isoform X1 [Glycine soja]|nr:probable calcium-binding protein CML23 isoform X1 [Glycine soja]RZB72795.1 putative calcium-binding protein CML27 [Glycine soja]
MDEEVRKIFSKFDKNGDGKISCAELKEMMVALGSKTTSEEVKRMMAELDRNGDGYIDLKEFGEFHCGGGDGRELREAFELYDLDKNGLISAKELHSVMRRLGEKCSLSDCRRMIGNVDADGDGNVNFEEFKKMMTRSYVAVSSSPLVISSFFILRGSGNVFFTSSTISVTPSSPKRSSDSSKICVMKVNKLITVS